MRTHKGVMPSESETLRTTQFVDAGAASAENTPVMAGGQAIFTTEDSLILSGESSGPDRLPPPFGSSGVDTSVTEHAPSRSFDGDTPGGLNSPESAGVANLPAASLPIPSAVIPDALSDERRIALEWKGPVKATQATQDGRYEIRGTRLKDSLLYYAWVMQPVPKLLGYPSTPEAARQLCQKHADG
jgi:hypothetical protein